jgi:hypothetical protein
MRGRAASADAQRLMPRPEALYRDEPFVKVVAPEKGRSPHTVGPRDPTLRFSAIR